ncbi:CatB-related O-acetyltransferase [Mariniflexile gromovii]|uniref:CatB-related O-acetyltransferase n=1 Tax=Mariniflexile gromovii TaxID=362523 RepID=A0ABS4BPE7_9FLAO|nr:CatB-related O-acetyltransferase [Mariniflexile gromovii]MBP0902468.1 CatB-related O-acetyltransferase [Mariniflexile gromovii]
MKNKVRILLWRILGFDYQTLLRKTDYVLLKDDSYTSKGNRTYDNGARVWRWTNSLLTIGNYCSIAHNVNFIMDEGFHNASKITNFPLIDNLFKNELTLPNGRLKKDVLNEVKQKQGITIGNDVWIGMGAYIMPGVIIGNGATIGSNSVVTKNVPDYAIVAGSPAKIIKLKHDEEIIKKLNEIAWWDWNVDTIKERIEDFNLSIEHFVNKYYNKKC